MGIAERMTPQTQFEKLLARMYGTLLHQRGELSRL